MKHLLFIVGQTATGKTSLAATLAASHRGEIINADSRQVYREMNIGTGKDLSDFQQQHIRYWLYNEVLPNEDWSVAHAVNAIRKTVTHIWDRGKLPIIVGGTGQYVQNILHAPGDITIPQDLELRKHLEKLNPTTLRNKLERLSEKKLSSMNGSDRSNPRRLIRAIEVETWKTLHKKDDVPSLIELDVCKDKWVGLCASDDYLKEKIEARVEKRLQEGMLTEVKMLMEKYPSWVGYPAFTATGYEECRAFIEGNITEDVMKEHWATHELQYAKRQMTWFKKDERIHWFDVSEPHPSLPLQFAVEQYLESTGETEEV